MWEAYLDAGSIPAASINLLYSFGLEMMYVAKTVGILLMWNDGKDAEGGI